MKNIIKGVWVVKKIRKILKFEKHSEKSLAKPAGVNKATRQMF